MTGRRALVGPRAALAVLLPFCLAACAGNPEAALSTGLAPDAGGAGFALASTGPGGGYASAAPTKEQDSATESGPAEEPKADTTPVAQPAGGKARIAMQPLPTVLPSERARTLSERMRTMLTAHGYEVVEGPQEGGGFYVLAADIVVEKDGKAKKVGVDWTVADALGTPLGKVSQSGTVKDTTTDAQWDRQATLAAAAAAEGISRIVSRGK